MLSRNEIREQPHNSQDFSVKSGIQTSDYLWVAYMT